ncbi:hypothetical protein QJS10_CPB22g01129 [Acorus calamus]|uniref:Uncharacterized protein n=1 Tax=Acorus calamus TaxID=4465 RepID=A0AAV9BYL3_ACOCL|nr:hypothetical protein QJS10_CPB22g01129 [Acorus calamus]
MGVKISNVSYIEAFDPFGLREQQLSHRQWLDSNKQPRETHDVRQLQLRNNRWDQHRISRRQPQHRRSVHRRPNMSKFRILSLALVRD